jgi:hypothetical protein
VHESANDFAWRKLVSDDLLTHDEALELLEPNLAAVARCSEHGWKQWETLRTDQPAMFAELGKRTRANFVYDGTIAHARREFPGTDGGPRLVKGRGGLMMLEVGGQLRLRFKRMRPNLSTSSIMTTQQMQLHMQLPLPGMGPATIATVGYVTNLIETGIERKLIVCRLDSLVLWVIELRDDLGLALPTTIVPQQPLDPRIGPVESGTIEIAVDASTIDGS